MVSSDEQSREGVSLDAQESRIRAYAAMRGLRLNTIYREEGGRHSRRWSGT
jgi:hypothetical protein